MEMRAVFPFLLAFVLTACAALAADSDGQPTLPQSSLVIDTDKGPARFTVELANTELARMHGLMFRKRVAPGAGMLFDFRNTAPRSFWMKNTLVSLDMLFIEANGRVATIAANTTPLSEAPIPSRAPVRAVLEI